MLNLLMELDSRENERKYNCGIFYVLRLTVSAVNLDKGT